MGVLKLLIVIHTFCSLLSHTGYGSDVNRPKKSRDAINRVSTFFRVNID